MTPRAAAETQRLLDAALYEPIPTGEATELLSGYGALLWRAESGLDLPAEFADTQPMEDA